MTYVATRWFLAATFALIFSACSSGGDADLESLVLTTTSFESSGDCSKGNRAACGVFPEETLLKEGDRTLAQAALQFVLQVPGVSTVIPGMVTPEQLDENIGALSSMRFDAAELQQIAEKAHAIA